jgi:hypothetical protein
MHRGIERTLVHRSDSKAHRKWNLQPNQAQQPVILGPVADALAKFISRLSGVGYFRLRILCCFGLMTDILPNPVPGTERRLDMCVSSKYLLLTLGCELHVLWMKTGVWFDPGRPQCHLTRGAQRSIHRS